MFLVPWLSPRVGTARPYGSYSVTADEWRFPQTVSGSSVRCRNCQGERRTPELEGSAPHDCPHPKPQSPGGPGHRHFSLQTPPPGLVAHGATRRSWGAERPCSTLVVRGAGHEGPRGSDARAKHAEVSARDTAIPAPPQGHLSHRATSVTGAPVQASVQGHGQWNRRPCQRPWHPAEHGELGGLKEKGLKDTVAAGTRTVVGTPATG